MSSKIIASTSSGTALNMSADTSGILEIQTGATPTTAITVDGSQNVGIGTNNPSFKLDTIVTTGNAIAVRPTSGSTGLQTALRLYGHEAITASRYVQIGCINNAGTDVNELGFYTGAGTSVTERMRITSGGNLCLGTTNPVGQISIGRAGGGQYISAVDTTTGYDIGYIQFNTDNMTLNPQGGSGGTTGYFRFNTAGLERMRINSSGNLLVGTTTTPAVAQCAVNYSSNYWQYGASTTGSSVFWVLNSSNTGVSLTSGNTSWAAQSDERTKDIIEPISDAASKVSSLRAVIGKYKTDEEGTRRSFLIAQDVQKVLPEVIDTDTDEQGTMSIRYTEVIPLLVAAIQEQQALITTLQTQVAALQNKVGV